MILASALVALGAVSASADPKVPAKPAPQLPAPGSTMLSSDSCARAHALGKTCVLSIEGIDFEGHPMNPDGDRFDMLDFFKAGSLIKMRRDFIQEIVKTAEDL